MGRVKKPIMGALRTLTAYAVVVYTIAAERKERSGRRVCVETNAHVT